ncbi:hypothetical protein EU519_01410 [Candidatus Thorarchaeota archaeon]|nr:MAG: hypothetical protein EU519_01410 [Candidatus Thorarchaeota archaeon]
MTDSIIQTAFGRAAPHVSNLQKLKEIVQTVAADCESPEDIITDLQALMTHEEVTVRTDIRILINEIRHILTGKTQDECL